MQHDPETATLGARLPAQLVALAPLAVALAACTAPPRVDVGQQWEESIANLNMFAIYPIAEDAQIGDVFLYAPESGRAGGRQFRLTRIDTVDPHGCVIDALRRQQAKRLRIEPASPPAPADAKATPAPVSAAVDASADCINHNGNAKASAAGAAPIFEVGNAQNLAAPIRMRRAAIPAFTAATITSGQLSGAGIIGQVGAALGLSASQDTAVTVTLGDVEEIAIDAGAARRLEEAQGARFLGGAGSPAAILDYVSQSRPDLGATFCRGDFEALAREGISFFIANRVMYAHSIEYGYQHNQQLDAMVQASIPLPGAAVALPAAVKPDPAAPAPADAAAAKPPATPAEAVAAAQARSLAARAALDAATPQSPGVKASFGIGRFGASSLRVTYAQPLAIGVGTAITLPVGELIRLNHLVAIGHHPQPQLFTDPAEAAAHRLLMARYAAVAPSIAQSFRNVAATCAEKYREPDWPANLAAFLARKPTFARAFGPRL